MINIRTNLFQSGQTIVEAIVVIGMVMLLVTGLISGTTASLKSSQSSKARNDATKAAEDGMELIRLLRDKNWSTLFSFADGTTIYCLDSDGVRGGSCTGNITTFDTKLTRTVKFSPRDAGNTLDVHLEVSYQDNGLKIVKLDTYLTQWK